MSNTGGGEVLLGYVNSTTNTKIIRFLVMEWHEEQRCGLFLVLLLVF